MKIPRFRFTLFNLKISTKIVIFFLDWSSFKIRSKSGEDFFLVKKNRSAYNVNLVFASFQHTTEFLSVWFVRIFLFPETKFLSTAQKS